MNIEDSGLSYRKMLQIAALFLGLTLNFASASAEPKDALGERIFTAANKAASLSPDPTAFSKLLSTDSSLRIKVLLWPNMGQVQRLTFAYLSVTDIVALLKFKIDWLSNNLLNMAHIDSNFSDDLPEQIEDIGLVYQRAMDRVLDAMQERQMNQREYIAISRQVHFAKKVISALAEKVYLKWVPADKGSGAVHKLVPDPEMTDLVRAKAKAVNISLQERLDILGEELRITSRAAKKWSQIRAECDWLLRKRSKK
jgi:hypothetical protein